MKNLGPKSWVFPMPVAIIGTYDENKKPNAMNAAWVMISDTHEISISLSNHKTTQNLLKTKAFTVSFATEDTIQACDYVGLVSGNDVLNKFEKAGFTALESEYVQAPIISELKLSLECSVKSYVDEILVGNIVNVSVDESILTNNEIDLSKLKPVIYDSIHHMYLSIGKEIAPAFNIGKQLTSK
ncbi:MAG: flavin reductase family protein [Erysipelotrichaceae bacterium]|nr:flavin reductase family protein [Erysipelotrichaceae bacterium]